jgi:hypothetical protein
MISDAGFKWDEQNLEHIAQHMVGPDEAEAVLGNKPRVLRTGDGNIWPTVRLTMVATSLSSTLFGQDR